jgi:hypothetical protein
MPKKKTTKKTAEDTSHRRPPGVDKAFWERHERAGLAVARKKGIGEEVRKFMVEIVERFTEKGFDPRKDIAWYMSQLGNDLRGDVEREKAKARADARKDEK